MRQGRMEGRLNEVRSRLQKRERHWRRASIGMAAGLRFGSSGSDSAAPTTSPAHVRAAGAPQEADPYGTARSGQPWPSRPREFHPEPLTGPYVNLSIHTARVTARRLPPSV